MVPMMTLLSAAGGGAGAELLNGVTSAVAEAVNLPSLEPLLRMGAIVALNAAVDETENPMMEAMMMGAMGGAVSDFVEESRRKKAERDKPVSGDDYRRLTMGFDDRSYQMGFDDRAYNIGEEYEYVEGDDYDDYDDTYNIGDDEYLEGDDYIEYVEGDDDEYLEGDFVEDERGNVYEVGADDGLYLVSGPDAY